MDHNAFLVGLDFGSFKTSITASNGKRDTVRTAVGRPRDHIARALVGGDVVFGERMMEVESAVDIIRPFAHGGLKYNPVPADGAAGDDQDRRREAARLVLKHVLSLVGSAGRCPDSRGHRSAVPRHDRKQADPDRIGPGDFRLRSHRCRAVCGGHVHGWRPAYDNRYLWLIESEIYHMQADSIQIGNSSNPNPQSSTTHYVYIAGNRFYENYENALDNKNSYHVIFSENDVHTFFAASDGGGANSTAIILSNNAEGPWTGYHWAINNRVWNSGLAIRDSGSEGGERNFAVGNVIWDVGTSFVQANNAADRECWIVNNTAVATDSHFDAWQTGGGSASTFVRRNVFVGGEMDIAGDIQSELVDNVLFGVDQRGNWDVDQGNVDSDPLLADAANGDMTPGAGSPAREAGAEADPVYALFESLYGLSIARDRAGTDRPSGAWELGAVETAP